ncbi:hypothetical protein DAPPUDRAFT_302568 [Daphnia pulex]|uniref:MARVEL domain-containing protein n=1 Tax=Daphnia pulex TaxID=6669 RepID=E9GEB5_DAPPU|nr:hypothetical protein DAPPUDRAFT_302568 [Daphnia pulex]|eukprot:EFX82335.1 hypothetical protein DAPPUDRAFT_302568 [Daphnia pulex]
MACSVFTFGNSFLGIFAFILQIVALIVSGAQWIPDLVCTGIWGGVFLFFNGIVIVKNKWQSTEPIKHLACCAILIGLTLIGMNSWSISAYGPLIADCQSYLFGRISLCGRVAIDSLLISTGIFTVLLNVWIFSEASSLIAS